MKIMILNNSGNVGKSFFSREFFLPNFEDGKIVEIESNNSSSSNFDIDVEKITAKEIARLNEFTLQYDNLIIDVGASQIENFFERLKQYDNLLYEIDLIVVPVPENTKEMEDSIIVLETLSELELGIPIKIFLNKVENLSEFDFFIDEAEVRNYKIDNNLIFEKYLVVKDLDKNKILSSTITNSKKDFREMAKEAYKSGDTEKGKDLAKKVTLQQQCIALRKDLDKKFAYLISTL